MSKIIGNNADRMVTPSEAAKILNSRSGPHHIRDLIRSGKLPEAVKIPDSSVVGYHYEIPLKAIERYRSLKFPRGWRRGMKRK